MAKAWKIPNLNPGERLDVALKKILAIRWREMGSYEKETVAGGRIEPVHNMRVSARRLQAFLKIFADVFPKKKFNRQYERLKEIIRSLGRVRQYDVLIARLEKEAKGFPPLERKGLDLLLARQEAARKEERKILLQTLKTLNRDGYKQGFSEFLK